MQSKGLFKIAVVLALGLAGFLVQAARAGNFHFTNVFFQLGSLEMQGDLAGLGNQPAEITLTGYGSAQALCQNKGGRQAPGRNPIVVNTQRTAVFVTDESGHAEVLVTAPDPTLADVDPSPTPKQAGCPNSNWEVVGFAERSMNWTAATLVVRDEAGVIQLSLSYACTTTFQDGVSTAVACVEN